MKVHLPLRFHFITLEVGGDKSEDCQITTVTGFVNPEGACFFCSTKRIIRPCNS